MRRGSSDWQLCMEERLNTEIALSVPFPRTPRAALPLEKPLLRYNTVPCSPKALTRVLSPCFYLHRLCYSGEISTLQGKARDPLLRAQANRIDNRGNSPLSLAILRHTGPLLTDLVALLLEIGANPRLKDSQGWNSLEVAQSKGEKGALQVIIQWLQRANCVEKGLFWAPIRSNLSALPDFYMELKWEFDSALVPILGRFLPNDLCKLWKLGSELRFDSTFAAIGKRREKSFVLRSPQPLDPLPQSPLLLINHHTHTVSDLLEPLDALEVEAVIDDLIPFEPQNRRISTTATLTPCRNRQGREVTGLICGFQTRKCRVEIDLQTDFFTYSPPLLPNTEETYFKTGTFPSNPLEKVPNEQQRSLLKGNLWLSESFPIKIKAFLPVLAVLGKGMECFARLHSFFSEDLVRLIGANSFPVKLDVPLHLSLRAVCTVTRFELGSPCAAHFIPANYPTKARRIAQKTLSSPKKRDLLRHFLL